MDERETAGPESRPVIVAQDLRLRGEPSIATLAHAVLPRGVAAVPVSAIPPGWIQLRAEIDGRPHTGWCMRRALYAALHQRLPPCPSAESRMWELAQQYSGRVGYRRGTKAEGIGASPPAIDCSGWVALLLREAMDAQNAHAGENVFDPGDIAACNTWSDRIILEIEARTPVLLEGRDIAVASLPRCATIGINEGYFAWQENHPRVRGINHIVQLVRRPSDDAPLISESHASAPAGVRLTPLAEWLDVSARHIRDGRAWAVDPFAMADPASAWATRTGGG